jgi:hypothetical protein
MPAARASWDDEKEEPTMRPIILAAVAMMPCVALADESKTRTGRQWRGTTPTGIALLRNMPGTATRTCRDRISHRWSPRPRRNSDGRMMRRLERGLIKFSWTGYHTQILRFSVI